MSKEEPAILVELDRAREKVEELREELDRAIDLRNSLVRGAKMLGHPAGEVYRRAGITASTYSRQGGDEASG
jgi:hypothetical protein